MADEDKKPESGKPSAKEKLEREISTRLNEAKGLQEKSLELHRKAEEAGDPKVSEDLKFQAREVDKKAAKLMKTAERLEAGWIQGGAMGTGLGVGAAGGIGAVVGTLVTGIVAIPTSGLGMLIGAGTGLIHGPWIKHCDAFSKDEAESIVKEAEEEAQRVAKS